MNKVREGYKITELGEIPNEWQVKKFKDISKVSQGLQIAIEERYKEYKEGRLPYITIQYINDKSNSDNEYFIENNNQNVICYEEDVLMTRTGNTGIVVTNEYGVFHNNFFKVDFDRGQLNKEFLVYYFNTPFMQNLIIRYAGTTTIPDLKHSDFYKLPVVIPKIEEQEKIASILSTVDEQIDNTEKLIQKNKELKKGLMQKLLTKGIGHTEYKKTELGEIPKEWEVKLLEDISKITRLAGAEYSDIWKIDEDGDVIALKGNNIGANKLILKDIEKITSEMSNRLIRSKLFNGDIVFPCVGTIGKATVINEDNKYHINQNIAKITPDNSMNSLFLSYFLMSELVVKEIYKYNTSSSQPNVLVGNLRKFNIVVPTTYEQKEIASILSAVDEKIEQYEKKKEKLKEAKRGLMQQLLTGKIRVV